MLTSRQEKALSVIRSTPHGTPLAYLMARTGQGRVGALITVSSLVERGHVVRIPDSRGRMRYFPNERARRGGL
jgi:hypothetical protein